MQTPDSAALAGANNPRLVIAKKTLATMATSIVLVMGISMLGSLLDAFGHQSIFKSAFTGLALLGLSAFSLRALLWSWYQPTQLSADETVLLPSLTVVIPAFNEGKNVRRSIESVLGSDYPEQLLTIIVVNDGSSDDTAEHINAIAAQYPQRVRAIHLPSNQGKRHALYTGFRETFSEYVATVDSDSSVHPDSLRNLLAPMIRNPVVSGVAGKVIVQNRTTNVITRMLGVRFILGFDFVRAYQSKLRSVWCCPGALQAYRVTLIRPHLKRWLNQRFLDAKCTNGDDHSMTNLVLSLGHDTMYQSNAVVETLVPDNYKQLCKMYIRWGRSATREGLLALRFVRRRAKSKGVILGTGLFFDALLQPVSIALRIATVCAGPYLLLFHPWAVVASIAMIGSLTLFYSIVFYISERSTDVIYTVLYAYFAVFALFWIQPFATATVRSNGWLTRG